MLDVFYRQPAEFFRFVKGLDLAAEFADGESFYDTLRARDLLDFAVGVAGGREQMAIVCR